MSSRVRAPKTTVVITGAAGQLGTQVLRRLIDDRTIGKIVAIDLIAPAAVSAKLHFVRCDIRDTDIGKHFEGADTLIHLAFVVTTRLERETFDAINVGGSINVFESAARAGIKQILYASSVAAYGVSDDLPALPDQIAEDFPRRLSDLFPYAAAKYRVEAFLDEFERAHPDTAVARIRPTILVGPRLNNPLGELFGRMLARGIIVGTGVTDMPMVWDEDVADAFILAMKKRASGAFNVSADEPIGMEAIARETGLRYMKLPKLGAAALPLLSQLTGKLSGRAAVDPSWTRTAEVRVNPTCEKVRRELGWVPKYPTSLAVMQHYLETAHGETDRRISAFMRLIAFAAKYAPQDPEMAGMNSVVYLAITGKGGADYSITVKDRRIVVRREIPRPPTSIATLDVDTFRDMLAGRLTYATAQVTGRIRIEGDTSAGFVLPALFARFRVEAEAKNIRGRAMRTFARYFAQGASR